VTVFSDRALSTRIAESSVSTGESNIVIRDLPSSLFDRSVRVSGEGTTRSKIVDVKVQTVFLDAK
jgi:hypothetical protein